MTPLEVGGVGVGAGRGSRVSGTGSGSVSVGGGSSLAIPAVGASVLRLPVETSPEPVPPGEGAVQQFIQSE